MENLVSDEKCNKRRLDRAHRDMETLREDLWAAEGKLTGAEIERHKGEAKDSEIKALERKNKELAARIRELEKKDLESQKVVEQAQAGIAAKAKLELANADYKSRETGFIEQLEAARAANSKLAEQAEVRQGELEALRSQLAPPPPAALAPVPGEALPVVLELEMEPPEFAYGRASDSIAAEAADFCSLAKTLPKTRSSRRGTFSGN